MSYPPQSYPSAPPGSGGAPTRLRGRTPLRLSVIFGVLGVVLLVVGGVVLGTESLSKVNDFARVPVAGGGTATLKSGNQLVYYEAADVSSSISQVPVPAIRLTAPDGTRRILNTLYGGAPRSAGRIKNKLTYDYNGHKGVAIYQLKIAKAGSYKVEVQPSGQERPGAQLAFGESIAGGTAVGALLLVLGVLLLLVAIILLIVGLVKRSRHKKELHQGYGGQYPPPGGYPGQQGGYPQQGGQGGYPQQGGQGGYPQQGGQGGYPQQGGQGGYPQQGGQGGYPQQGGQGGGYPQQGPSSTS